MYLDKFSDLIRKRQAEQILRLLNKQKNTGQIRTIEEFTTKLDNLTRELLQTTLIPSLKIYQAEGDSPTDSETHNFMLDRVQDDLEAAFEESLNVNEVQISHEAIVRDVLLKNLRYGVAELESKVALYEFLNKDKRGFDSAIFSTFRESKEGRTSRSIEQPDTIFYDPRANEVIELEQDAAIDPVGERLTLSTDNKTYHNIRNVKQIFDGNAPQSSLIVEPPASKLINMIDGQKGTFWLQSLLFDEPRDSVNVKIELDLGGTKSINFIEIEPASRFGLVLESIFYLDGNSVITELASPEITILSPAAVSFRSVTTRKLILVFRNDNSRKVQFEYNPTSDTLLNQALSEPVEGYSPDIGAIAKDLDEILQSAKVKDVIRLPSTQKNQFIGYEFQTGIDNIWVGLANYNSRSIYVSSPLNVEDIGQIGLKVSEQRPAGSDITSNPEMTETTYDTDDDTFFHSSIEYWIIKRDLDANDNITGITRFPILPLGVTRVHHERLVLTEKSTALKTINDVGYTQFFTDRIEGEVRVYRNGIELLSTEDFATADGWEDLQEASHRTPNTGQRMRMKIKIQQPLPGDIFTVTYTPLVSNSLAVPKTISEYASSGLAIVDLTGDLAARSFENQLVLVDKPNDRIAKSILFLGIIIRNNTADPALSASVEEYMMVVGHKDQSKFKGLEE